MNDWLRLQRRSHRQIFNRQFTFFLVCRSDRLEMIQTCVWHMQQTVRFLTKRRSRADIQLAGLTSCCDLVWTGRNRNFESRPTFGLLFGVSLAAACSLIVYPTNNMCLHKLRNPSRDTFTLAQITKRHQEILFLFAFTEKPFASS